MFSNSTTREFYFIKPGDSVSRVLMSLYGYSVQEVARILPAVAENNPHIKDLNHVRPGNVLDTRVYTPAEGIWVQKKTDLLELEQTYGQFDENEKELVERYPHALDTILKATGSTAVAGSSAFMLTMTELTRNLNKAVGQYGNELKHAFGTGQRGTLQTELRNMVLNRQPVANAYRKFPTAIREFMIARGKDMMSPLRFTGAKVQGQIRRVVRLAPKAITSYHPFNSLMKEYKHVIKNA